MLAPGNFFIGKRMYFGIVFIKECERSITFLAGDARKIFFGVGGGEMDEKKFEITTVCFIAVGAKGLFWLGLIASRALTSYL